MPLRLGPASLPGNLGNLTWAYRPWLAAAQESRIRTGLALIRSTPNINTKLQEAAHVHDRKDAARKLAAEMKGRIFDRPLVLAIPRGAMTVKHQLTKENELNGTIRLTVPSAKKRSATSTGPSLNSTT